MGPPAASIDFDLKWSMLCEIWSSGCSIPGRLGQLSAQFRADSPQLGRIRTELVGMFCFVLFPLSVRSSNAGRTHTLDVSASSHGRGCAGRRRGRVQRVTNRHYRDPTRTTSASFPQVSGSLVLVPEPAATRPPASQVQCRVPAAQAKHRGVKNPHPGGDASWRGPNAPLAVVCAAHALCSKCRSCAPRSPWGLTLAPIDRGVRLLIP